MAATGGILFVDSGEALGSARTLLDRKGIAVETTRWDSTTQGIGSRPEAPSVVVIGPRETNPAGIARRLREAYPLIHVVFVAPTGGYDALRSTLLFSAPANTPWQLAEAGEEEVAKATIASFEAARRTRQVRTTLDRVNLRLATPATADTQAWRRLVVSDQFLATVLKHAQDAIISLDINGTVLSWNDGAVRMFGRKAEEVVGERIDRVVHWTGSLKGLVEAAIRERYVRSELHCEVGGRGFTIAATFSAIEDRSEVLAVAAILRDVTERVRTEAALAANEARFRAVADNIPQLAWMTDETGAVTWYNRRWYEYTGTTFEQMRGWGWKAVNHPDHFERVLERFLSRVAAGEEWEDTLPLRSKDGEFRWFLSRAFPIRDEYGRVTQWFGTNTDITEERAAQEALREADRRKNEFISMLSHELRNPLAPIRNSIFLLDRVETDSVAASKARVVIRRQTEHLTRLVEDLLDVTRVMRGKIVLAQVQTDLAAVVRAATEDHRGLIETAGLVLRQSIPTQPLGAQVDAARITQVLGNLLQNALKFTPPGGWIEVELRGEDGFARVDVRDSGAGIEPELLPTLFQPFVQGERSLARGRGGLGLGLALARGIAEMHGGTLEAYSPGPDRGTQFTLRLPLHAGAAVGGMA